MVMIVVVRGNELKRKTCENGTSERLKLRNKEFGTARIGQVVERDVKGDKRLDFCIGKNGDLRTREEFF